MSSYYNPNKNFIFNDEQIFLKKVNNMPNNKRMYLSASSTVEASIVVPLFIYAIMTVTYLIQIVGIQVKVQQTLYNESRKMAKYIYANEMINDLGTSDSQKEDLIKVDESGDKDEGSRSILENGIGVGIAQTLFISELGAEYIKKSHIVGGVAGFNMMNSKIMSQNNMINIVVSYTVRNPFDIFGIGIMTFTQSASTNAWLGDTYNADKSHKSEDSSNTDETIVYITPSGSVYHTNRNCSYLILSIHEIAIDQLENQRNESGGKYYACEKCGTKNAAGEFFITDYGDRYHTTVNCSALMRNVMAVQLSKVLDRKQCGKCKGD